MNCMPIWKACNRQIDYLDRSHCNLIAVPDDILRYKTLEELFLDFNQLRDLPRSLYKLVNLRKLSVSENEIVRLSSDIGSLVNLEELNVSQNDLQEIPDTIRLCKELTVLDISNNPLQKLPDGLTQLGNLTRLCLNNISLARLPVDIGSLSVLEQLELRDNSIKYLPATLCSLKQLKSLDLGSNSLEDLPETIGGLSSLEELLLDNNELGYLPKEIGALKKLNQLDVSNNKLDRMPNEIGGLVNLTDLLLSENLLEYLPESIGYMKKLTILKADQNRILLLTSNIGSCHMLQELILTENLLQELPITIGKLRNLVILNADRNRLSHLPKEVGMCSRLGVLSVRDNKLEVLPSEVGNLKVLHVLDVSGNKLRYLPISLGSCNLKAIWLSENQAQPMLKFQQDVDPETGQKILICFLLPQQAALTQSTINLMRLDKNIKPVADNRESWNGETRDRQSAIRFTEDLPKHEKESEGQFVRQNTPFPKDLRTRKPAVKEGGTEANRKSLEIMLALINGTPEKDLLITSKKCSETRQHKKPTTNSLNHPDNLDSRPNGFIPNSNGPHKWPLSQPQPSGGENIRKPVNQPNIIKSQPSINNNIPKKRVESEADSDDDDDDDEDEEIEEQEITIKFVRKAGVGLGISIAGGVGSTPYRDDDDGVFLSRVTEEGPSWKAGLRPGDKLIEVNGRSLLDADHHKAVEVLKEAGCSVTMVVLRVVKLPPSEIISTVLHRGSVGLGFSIAGGKGSPSGEEAHISRITEGGLAAQDGKLRVGDRLLSINEVSVRDASHERVVQLLRESGQKIRLTVSRESGTSNKSVIPQVEPAVLPRPRTASTPNPPSTLNYATNNTNRYSQPNQVKSPPVVTPSKPMGSISFEKVNNNASSDSSSKETSPESLKSPTSVKNGGSTGRYSASNNKGPSDRGPVGPPARGHQPVSPPDRGRQPGLDDNVPHDSDEEALNPARPVNGYQNIRDDTRRSQGSRDNLDYQIPHIERRVGLNEGEAYLDPVDGRSIPDSLTNHRKDLMDMDKPVPHADDQVHFVKQKVSHMDEDIPSADYQMNYVTKPVTKPTSTSQADTQPYVRVESGPVLKPPPTLTARIPSSPVLTMKTPKPASKPDQPTTLNNNVEKVPPRARTKSTTVDTGSKSELNGNNSAVDALFNSLDRSYDGDRSHRSSTRRSKPPSVSSTRSSSVPPRELPSTTGNGNMTRPKGPYPIEKVTVYKAGGPLGLSIVGGLDHISYPYGVDESGVFVSKIIPKGAASKTSLQVGDRILSVNGKSIKKASHQEAVAALCAPNNEVVLEVRRDPQPPGLKELSMNKQTNEKLGLSIRGGNGNQAGNPLDVSDDGIFISKITDGGAVARDGRLKVGMRILDVNGQSLLGCSHHEAVNVLRSVVDRLVITVCDGYDPSFISLFSTSPSLSGSLQHGRFNSNSSIDRCFDDSGIGGKSKSRKNTSMMSSSEDEIRGSTRRKPPVANKPQKFRTGSVTSLQASNDQLNSSFGSVPGDIGGSVDDVRGKKRTKSSKTRSKSVSTDPQATKSTKKKSSKAASSNVANASSSSLRETPSAMIFQRPV